MVRQAAERSEARLPARGVCAAHQRIFIVHFLLRESNLFVHFIFRKQFLFYLFIFSCEEAIYILFVNFLLRRSIGNSILYFICSYFLKRKREFHFIFYLFIFERKREFHFIFYLFIFS